MLLWLAMGLNVYTNLNSFDVIDSAFLNMQRFSHS